MADKDNTNPDSETPSPALPGVHLDRVTAALLPMILEQLRSIFEKEISDLANQLKADIDAELVSLTKKVEALGPGEIIKLVNSVKERVDAFEAKLKHWV